MYQELRYLETFPNIKFFKQRYRSFWGSNSVLFLLLQGMRELLEAAWDWDYVMNISESDFPVRPIQEFEEHLKRWNGGNFVAMGKDEMLTFHEGQVRRRKFMVSEENKQNVPIKSNFFKGHERNFLQLR